MESRDIAAADASRRRRWSTIEQIAEEYGKVFTPAAIRALIQRSRPHYNSRGEWVAGNGLASAICQPGGKHGKVMVDAVGFALWLERWTRDEMNPETIAT
jgi:hypothetical protein